MGSKSRAEARQARHRRVRAKVRGSAERPRMAVMISNKHMYVQFIDDERGVTLASASTLGADGGHNLAAATRLGQQAGASAVAAGIRRVVVDRGGYRFHGRVKAIVEAARQAGLQTATKEGT